MPRSVEGTQKFVKVTTPHTETRIDPRIRAAVGWPTANSRPTARSQIVAQLERVARGGGVRGQLRSTAEMAKAVIPDQVEWMARGPAGDGADWNEREDQDAD